MDPFYFGPSKKPKRKSNMNENLVTYAVVVGLAAIVIIGVAIAAKGLPFVL